MGLLCDMRALRYARCIMCNGPLSLHGNRCMSRHCDMRKKEQTQCKALKRSVVVEGDHAADLKTQILVVYNCIIGVQQNLTHLQLGCNHKAIERIYDRLRNKIANAVRMIQDNIQLNPCEGKEWAEVEVDEVTLRKIKMDGQVSWIEYLGM
eukprot:6210933-Amphidinium_carterae.1